MTEAAFWKLISAANADSAGDPQAFLDGLREALERLPAEELADYDRLYTELRNRAFRWDLWGAAFLLNGGCSDDGFEYFLAWLISRGLEVYAAALNDPDSLADAVDGSGDYEFEEFMSVGSDAYEAVTGEPLKSTAVLTDEPAGEQWEEEELESMFPRIADVAF